MRYPEPMPVRRVVEAAELSGLGFEILAAGHSLDDRLIANPRIQKPGLALAGFLPYVKAGRLQIVGHSEYAYLRTLGDETAVHRWRDLIDAGVPAIVSAKGIRPPAEVLEHCEKRGVPFLLSPVATSVVISTVSIFLERELAPTLQIHGVLMDVFSMGTLIVGDPGIGKSECALELVMRGHRLVADDVVVVRHTHGEGLVGSPHRHLESFLELRGVGIIDVQKHFGMTASSPSVKISLVVQLVKLSEVTRERERRWREQLMTSPKPWTQTRDILGVDVPEFTMAVAPGRDVAVMVETAVRKCLLASQGVDDERAFLEKVNRRARGGAPNRRGWDDE